MKSEFIASQDLDLYLTDGKPSGSCNKSKKVLIKKGEKIEEVFVQHLLLHNRNFISNLKYENGVLQLSKEQEKKYEITFKPHKPQKLKIEKHKWTKEKLTLKLNELKKEFKNWAEEEFGEDNIDKRSSGSKIINEILKLQDKRKQ